MKRITYWLLIFLLLASCKSHKSLTNKQFTENAKKQEYVLQKHQFRAAWFPNAWRSEYQGKSAEEIQRSLIKRLDLLRSAGFNAVVFQIRSEADAWYQSPLEPWSRTLTGTQGQAPVPFWDPLSFMIAECHKRGMELHAWVNPYRASTNTGNILSPKHPFHRHPEWFFVYGTQLYFNPALEEVRAYLCKVVGDIVERYDVDAIHMDDYFYPYPIAGIPLPDFQDYTRAPRGFSNISDWRRDNVSQLIHDLHDTIKGRKPYVQFGISPFGIWRNAKIDPHGSATNGLQNYDDLYADILLWDACGWIDYIVPQLYWEIGHKTAEYTELARWWSTHITQSHYYIGESVEKMMDKSEMHTKAIISNQVARGVVLWPADLIFSDYKGVTSQLQTAYWTKPALIPPTPYPQDLQIINEPQRETSIVRHNGQLTLFWEPDMEYPEGQETKYFVIYLHKKGEKPSKATRAENLLAFRQTPFYELPYTDGKHSVAFTVTRINRYNQEILVAHDIRTKL